MSLLFYLPTLRVLFLFISYGTHLVQSKAFFFNGGTTRDCVCVPYYMCHSSEQGAVFVLRETSSDVRHESRMTVPSCPRNTNEAIYCCTPNNLNVQANKPLNPLRHLRQIPISADQMARMSASGMSQTNKVLISSQARPVLQTTFVQRQQGFNMSSPVSQEDDRNFEADVPGFGQQGSVSLISVPDTEPSDGSIDTSFQNQETNTQNQQSSIQNQRPPIQNQRPPIQNQRPPIQNQRPLNNPDFTNGVQRCGQLQGLDLRLQGGSKGKAPWVVSLWKQPSDVSSPWKAFCGGSLILENVVLTAAHCLTNFDRHHETIAIRSADGTQQIPVSRTVSHPNFNSGNLHNDIALLFLARAISLGPEFETGITCLSPPDTDMQNIEPQSCVATGFDDQGAVQSVEVPIVPRDNCQQLLRTTRLGAYFRLDMSFMCAGGQFGRDTCQGDGGSPLFCMVGSGDQAVVTQLGIVSWGIGCGVRDVPGVYASTSFGSNWVDSEIRAAGLNPLAYRAVRNNVQSRVHNNRRS